MKFEVFRFKVCAIPYTTGLLTNGWKCVISPLAMGIFSRIFRDIQYNSRIVRKSPKTKPIPPNHFKINVETRAMILRYDKQDWLRS